MECKRCGHCCMAVGREFWLRGDYENKPEYPDLQKLAKENQDQGDDMPCRMLIVRNGKSSCTIQIMYGQAAKPEVCRTYPWLECHQQQKTYRGQGVCSQKED